MAKSDWETIESPDEWEDIDQGQIAERPQPAGVAEFIREEGTPAVGAMAGAAAGAKMGLPFGPYGVAGGALIGAGVGGGGARLLQRIYEHAMGYGPQRTTAQVTQEMGEAATAQMMGEGAGRLIGAAAKPMLPAIRRTGAQAIRAMTGVPEREAAAVLADPNILSRALPISRAGQLYREGVGEAAEGSMEAGRQIFGKTYPGAEAAVNAFDELAPYLDAAKPNELLGMRQAMMDALADTSRAAPKLRKLLSERLQVLDEMLENRLPDWTGARQAYREAKIGEEFGSWLPLNKNLSPNVLRTTAAIGSAAYGVKEGSPWPVLALGAVSPRLWGIGLRGAASAGGIAELGARTGVQTLADYYNSGKKAP